MLLRLFLGLPLLLPPSSLSMVKLCMNLERISSSSFWSYASFLSWYEVWLSPAACFLKLKLSEGCCCCYLPCLSMASKVLLLSKNLSRGCCCCCCSYWCLTWESSGGQELDSPPEKSKFASFNALFGVTSTFELLKVCSSQLLEVDSKNDLGWRVFCALYSKLASISFIVDRGAAISLNS